MKSFWTLFWEREIPWITIITGMLGMIASQGTAIIGPREWKEAAQTAIYSLHTETWLEWKFSLWPPLILAITVGIVKTTRAFLRTHDNFYPLHPKRRIGIVERVRTFLRAGDNFYPFHPNDGNDF